MKYYLVALFDDESYKNLSPIQKNLSKRYKANRNSPIPYIPLEVLENPNIDKLNLVIDKVLNNKVTIEYQVNPIPMPLIPLTKKDSILFITLTSLSSL